MDTRNVQDRYKGWTEDLIKDDLKTRMFPYAILMDHLQGDFNLGTIVRNANAFGAQKMFYTGKKKWDRRGATGTHHYTDVEYIKDATDLNDYVWVGLENTETAIPLFDFEWPENSLMIIGEEGSGISEDLLIRCNYIVAIPQFGSVRSLNAGTAAGIAMYDFVQKFI